MTEKLTPEQLRELEGQRQEELVHKIKERDDAIAALEADKRRLLDAETLQSGETQKAHQEYKATVESMDDETFNKHVADLTSQERKKEHERSGTKLTLGGPHE